MHHHSVVADRDRRDHRVDGAGRAYLAGVPESALQFDGDGVRSDAGMQHVEELPVHGVVDAVLERRAEMGGTWDLFKYRIYAITIFESDTVRNPMLLAVELGVLWLRAATR